MAFLHEVVSFTQNIPINFIINRIGTVERHWHQSIELNFITEGSVNITVNDKSYSLSANDAILINSNEMHELNGRDATIITLQIKLDLIKNLNYEIKNAYFVLNTAENGDDNLSNIKHIVANLLKFNIEGGRFTEIMNISLCYQLVYELYSSFSGVAPTSIRSHEQLDRLGEILNIINSEYASNLSLESISRRIYVTVPYLSRFFKSCMNVTISDYIKSIRLYHAVSDLTSSSSSIDAIAENNGFPNNRAFVTAFKEKYGVLPSVWRGEHFEGNFSADIVKEKALNYFDVDPSLINSCISSFINDNLSGNIDFTHIPNEQINSDIIEINASEPLSLSHSCRMFIGVSRARELMYENIREELKKVQSEIGFKYIKIHGLLDDDMMVYGKTSSGAAIYNFNRIDYIFDFLLSIGLRPLVQLSFMPSELALTPDKKTFWAGSVTSEPKSMKKWATLVKELTLHLICKYGKKEVEGWLFSVWNEPSSSNKMFGFKNDDVFTELYDVSYHAVKEIDPNLKFGGPSSFSAYGKSEDWLFMFLNKAKERNIVPDFIDVHYYDIDLSDVGEKISDTWGKISLSPVENSFSIFIDRLIKRLEDEGFSGIPVYIIEWNSTVSHRDPLNDTCFKSSYIAKNILENYDRLQGFGYWLLSDSHDEFLLPPYTFHGGLGMFTANGIPKPAFYVYKMFASLGDKLIAKGKGYFVTQKDDGTKVAIIYNYFHYDIAYAKEVGVNITYTERYSVFPQKAKATLNLLFPDLKKQCLVRETILNRRHGSAFDNFVKMGGIEPFSDEEISFLKLQTVPQIKKRLENPNDSGLTLGFTLEPFEVRLVEIETTVPSLPQA